MPMDWSVKANRAVIIILLLFTAPLAYSADSLKTTSNQIDAQWWEQQTKDVEYFSEKPEHKQPRTFSPKKDGFNWSQFSFLKYLVLLLIVAILIYVLYRLYGQSAFEFSGTKTTKKLLHLNEEDLEERFLEMDLEKLLKQALTQEKWKMVIRLRFLQILKILVDQEKVRWHSDLTNRQISYQLPPKTRKGFTYLVSIYEMSWYSNAKVNRAFYDKVKPKFDHYQKELLNG